MFVDSVFRQNGSDADTGALFLAWVLVSSVIAWIVKFSWRVITSESHKKRSVSNNFLTVKHNADSTTGCVKKSQYSSKWLWYRYFITWLCWWICLLVFDIDLRSRCPCQQGEGNHKVRRGHIFDDRREHYWTAQTWECRVCCIFLCNFAEWLTYLIAVLITVSLRTTCPARMRTPMIWLL